jgi:SAM-dependent methyltransferase
MSLEIFDFPPNNLVTEQEGLLRHKAGGLALDAGCSFGRNSYYLAEKGLDVVSVSNQPEELLAATELLSRKSLAGHVHFLAGNIVQLPFPERVFDVAVCNEVLQEIPKDERMTTLRGLAGVTKDGGFNIVSGYVVDSQNDDPSAKWFRPGELRRIYESFGWRILRHKDEPTQTASWGGKLHATSRTLVVAARQ